MAFQIFEIFLGGAGKKERDDEAFSRGSFEEAVHPISCDGALTFCLFFYTFYLWISEIDRRLLLAGIIR